MVLWSVVISVFALIGTLIVGKEVNQKIREYGRNKKNRVREEQSRSLQYEKSTFSRMRVYILIYGITFSLAILSLAIYFSQL